VDADDSREVVVDRADQFLQQQMSSRRAVHRPWRTGAPVRTRFNPTRIATSGSKVAIR
jgi:hypothetical protein